ncbi:MAG: twin-arginine translocase subunit TatC [Microbacteriaceae bacterium]
MSLGAHLVELRKRLFRAALGVLVGAVGGWFLAIPVWDILREPIAIIAGERSASINYASVAGAFDLRIQVAIVVGLVIASPIWLYQLFAFLVPGLTKREKRFTFGFFFSAVPLFFAGCATGVFVLPNIVNIMLSFVPSQDTSIVDAKIYLDFVLKLVIATGVAFVLPAFLVLLNFMGILSAKAIIKGWRWAILAITLFTAITTPGADVMSMFLLAIPMVGLYFLAYGIAVWHDRIAAKRAAKAEAALMADA